MRFDQLEYMSAKDLKAKAKELGIEGADSMKKADLIEAIIEVEGDQDQAAPEEASAGADNAAASSPEPAQFDPGPTASNAGYGGNKKYENHPKFDKFKKGNEQ